MAHEKDGGRSIEIFLCGGNPRPLVLVASFVKMRDRAQRMFVGAERDITMPASGPLLTGGGASYASLH